jgi:hypothetical protein
LYYSTEMDKALQQNATLYEQDWQKYSEKTDY